MIDAKEASVELTKYISDVLTPPPGGAQLGSILGAYIFKAVLRDAGYAIVPIDPSPEMKQAYKRGWLRSFRRRYDALIQAGWPDEVRN